MRDGYVARWRGREYQASPDGAEVRIYQPEPGEGFEEVRPGRYVRVLSLPEVEDLAYVRTMCTWHGQPFIVLAEHDGLPPGVPVGDNEAGWREALAKLAALVEER